MNKTKIAKLKKHGWRVGSAADFLNLSPAEEAFIELKASLAKDIQKRRQEIAVTQLQLAQCMHSSQSRIAKIENNDPTVSIDLMVKTLFALRTSTADIMKTITSSSVITREYSLLPISLEQQQTINPSPNRIKAKSLIVSR